MVAGATDTLVRVVTGATTDPQVHGNWSYRHAVACGNRFYTHMISTCGSGNKRHEIA